MPTKTDFDALCTALAAQIMVCVSDTERKLRVHRTDTGISSDACDPKRPNAPVTHFWTYGQPPDEMKLCITFDYEADWTPFIVVSASGADSNLQFAIGDASKSQPLLEWIREQLLRINQPTLEGR